jgi:hypothetical protein
MGVSLESIPPGYMLAESIPGLLNVYQFGLWKGGMILERESNLEYRKWLL